MNKIFLLIWDKLAERSFGQRFFIKLALFSIILLFAHFPNAALFAKQVDHLLNVEQLIQTDFPGITEINHEIDRLLPPNPTRSDEFKVTQDYVYRNISYEFDWNLWGNADYWPTAEEVWTQKREDCDGEAVLAASILRSRGFKTATLAGNIQHIWVVVDADELMMPDDETNFTTSDGAISVAIPSWRILFDGIVFYLVHFPAKRILLIFITAIILCFHPYKNLTAFLGLAVQGLVGQILLLSWAGRSGDAASSMDSLIGVLLLASSLVFTLIIPNVIPRLRLKNHSVARAEQVIANDSGES